MSTTEAIFVFNNTDEHDENDILEQFISDLDVNNPSSGNQPIQTLDMYGVCPFCRNVVMEFQQTDDVSHPMIWCRRSKDCDCMSVLLRHTARIVSHDDVEYDLSDEEFENPVFFAVKLALIKKMTDHRMSAFSCESPLPNDVARKFSEDFADHKGDEKEFLQNNDIAKKYNIHYEPNSEKTLNVGIAVDSYDVSRPAVAYPACTSLKHDGVFINLLCVDENGNEFHATLSGEPN